MLLIHVKLNSFLPRAETSVAVDPTALRRNPGARLVYGGSRSGSSTVKRRAAPWIWTKPWRSPAWRSDSDVFPSGDPTTPRGGEAEFNWNEQTKSHHTCDENVSGNL